MNCPECYREMHVCLNFEPGGQKPSTFLCFNCGQEEEVPGNRLNQGRRGWADNSHEYETLKYGKT